MQGGVAAPKDGACRAFWSQNYANEVKNLASA